MLMLSRVLSGVSVGLGSLAIQVVAFTVGIAAASVTAMVTPSPSLLISAGLAVYVGSAASLVWLVTRGRPDHRRTVWLVTTGVLTLVVAGLASFCVFRPVEDPHTPPGDMAALNWWVLTDGARISYTHSAPDGRSHEDPVVFLHGGPGVADLSGDSAYFGALSADGYDVYVYDQLGTGHSARLHDPSGYTLDRWVADLEEIRLFIGADRMILIGHSWGARIAIRYLERHPGHVSRLVLSAPGAIPGSDDGSGAGLVPSLPDEARGRVLSLVMHPRMLASYGLLQVNPEASRNLTSDPEMDARFDRVYNASRPAYHCPGAGPGPELHGLGFYAHQFPQSARSPADPDIRNKVSDHAVPTLIVKGRCDYLSWTSAVEYVEALSDTTLVYLEDAGHNAYQDQPEVVLESVRSFLRGDHIVPLQRHDTSMPDGYLGPP